MSRTKIEWTETTWNPLTGCTPISPGCAHCYARRMAQRLAGRCGYPAAPHEFEVTLHPERLSEPLGWKKPRRVFVCSMGDLFHESVPFEYIARVYGVMTLNQQHTFQVLTKRPYRAVDFIHWAEDRYKFARTPPPNIWLGATIENQEQADKRIPVLLQIPAAVRFVSVEPLLGPVYPLDPQGVRLDWVICGGETGPGARPMHPDWARSLRDQCAVAGVPFFFKKMGSAWRGETPPDLLVREYPAQDFWAHISSGTHSSAPPEVAHACTSGTRPKKGHLS